MNVTVSAGREVYLADYEFMAGRAEDEGTTVVDVMSINSDSLTIFYTVPQNIPAGYYHVRVNITTNITILDDGPASLQQLTQRSSDIVVTSPTFECTTPPSWTNIASPSDPNYRSLRIISPAAGDVWSLGGDAGEVSWTFLDGRNQFGSGIENLQMTIVQQGNTIAEATLSPDPSSAGQLFQYNPTAFTPGTYEIHATYSNAFEASPVTAISQPFYFAGAGSSCDGLQASNSTSVGGSSSSGGNASGAWRREVCWWTLLVGTGLAMAFVLV